MLNSVLHICICRKIFRYYFNLKLSPNIHFIKLAEIVQFLQIFVKHKSISIYLDKYSDGSFEYLAW